MTSGAPHFDTSNMNSGAPHMEIPTVMTSGVQRSHSSSAMSSGIPELDTSPPMGSGPGSSHLHPSSTMGHGAPQLDTSCLMAPESPRFEVSPVSAVSDTSTSSWTSSASFATSMSGMSGMDWFGITMASPTNEYHPPMPFPPTCITPLTPVMADYPIGQNYNRRPTEPCPACTAQEDSQVPSRPHSSPCMFGPTVEDLIWTGNPMQFPKTPEPSPGQVGFPTTAYQAPPRMSPSRRYYGVPIIQNPQPQRIYTPLPAQPYGVSRASTRKRSLDEGSQEAPTKRRKRSSLTSPPPAVSGPTEEDKLLLRLKDEESLPWKDIAARIQSETGKTHQIPALQMRLKRLRERMRVWNDSDVEALRMAHDYWQNYKFDIISNKMTEFGASEKWSAKMCARKWEEITQESTAYAASQPAYTTGFSYTASPTEGPGFLPFVNMAP